MVWTNLSSRPEQQRDPGDGQIVVVILVFWDDHSNIPNKVDRLSDETWNVLERTLRYQGGFLVNQYIQHV